MLHGRRLLVATIIAITILGTAINAAGPFRAHPALAYPQLLADFEAGRVEQIAQWRDRLEVTEGSGMFLIEIPDGADFPLDLARARMAGGVGYSLAVIPDDWLVPFTPWVPALLLVAGLVIWLRAVLLGRRDGWVQPGDPALP